MFFSGTIQKHVCWKIFSKFRKFSWLYCHSIAYYFQFQVSWVHIMSEVFLTKWVTFFGSFCWLWDSLLKNLKLKSKLWWCPLNRVDEYKKLYARKFFCKKLVSNMRFWIIYILVQIFTQLPPPTTTIKKLPTALL